jgi:hypothetical protein
MSFKPTDFFIGVIDFFSVLLPGALLVYFFMGQGFDSSVFGVGRIFPQPATDAEKWIIFFVAVYITGNVIFLVASMLLDGLVYDRYLRNIFFKKNFDLSYKAATHIREQYIGSDVWVSRLRTAGTLSPEDAEQIVESKKTYILNTFKWAQHFLALNAPALMTEIRKIEADSKFFRSLVIVFLIISCVLLFQQHWLSATVCLVLAFLCLYRYGNLRYKCTERAYELIITTDASKKQELLVQEKIASDNRFRFIDPKNNNETWNSFATSVMKGTKLTGPLVVIPPSQTWKTVNNPADETLVCVNGKAIVSVSRNDRLEQIALRRHGVLKIDKNSSFEMTNQQDEPLVLLALK